MLLDIQLGFCARSDDLQKKKKNSTGRMNGQSKNSIFIAGGAGFSEGRRWLS
jgi:hypothetical protein